MATFFKVIREIKYHPATLRRGYNMLNARRSSTLSDGSEGVELDDNLAPDERPLLHANGLQNSVSFWSFVIFIFSLFISMLIVN